MIKDNDPGMNELLSVLDPDSEQTVFEYDELLRETSRIFPNGISTHTAYGPAGRITSIKNDNDDGPWGHEKKFESEAYLYNDAGERTFTVDSEGLITTYKYDELGRIETVYYPFGSGLFPEYSVENGRGRGRNKGDTFTFPYAPMSGNNEQLMEEKLSAIPGDKDELYRKYSHMDKNMKGNWHVTPGEGATEFASWPDIEYEEELSLIDAFDIIRNGNDSLDTSKLAWTETYEYDTGSNRTAKANGWGQIDYTYNAANEILSAGNRGFNHDPNGNLLAEVPGDVEANYTYNPENRVTDIYSEISGFVGNKEWSLEGGVGYDYDAFGRRTSKTDYTLITRGGNQSREWKRETNRSYLYDGPGFNVLAELKDAAYAGPNTNGHGHMNSHAAGHHVLNEYLYANGDIISRTEFTDHPNQGWRRAPGLKGKEYYSSDILGSVMMLTDAKGHVKESYKYDVFGNVYEGSFSKVNAYGYNGKRFDPSAGLYDYGFRDYDPVNYTDPFGLCASDAQAARDLAEWEKAQEPTIPDTEV